MNYAVSKVRRQFLGNIRFMGELFKNKLIKSHAIMNCTKLLLVPDNEEKLESLCKLLTTIGQVIEVGDTTVSTLIIIKKVFLHNLHFMRTNEIYLHRFYCESEVHTSDLQQS